MLLDVQSNLAHLYNKQDNKLNGNQIVLHTFGTQVLVKQNSTPILDKIATAMESPNNESIQSINKEAKMRYTYKFINENKTKR